MNTQNRAQRRMRRIMLVMAVGILVPSLYGFGTKFLEFIALYRGDVEGVFAISPILNYLLASTGFLCLFAWAIMHGMFRDIERPKYTMLETEQRLDAEAPWRPRIGMQYPASHRLRMPSLETSADPNRFREFYEHDE
jgi:hypothetical protein